MSSAQHILVYVTHPMSNNDQAILLELLNQPNRQYTQPYNLPDLLRLAESPNQIGKSIDELVETHKRWVAANGINVETSYGASIFVVADEKSAPGARPRTVLLVNTLEGGDSGESDEPHQSFRAPVSQAVGALTAIDGGQVGWEEFYFTAHDNEGVLPQDEEVDTGEERFDAVPPEAEMLILGRGMYERAQALRNQRQ